MKKILTDQILCAPFFGITFFGGCALLEGKSYNQFIDEFKRKFPAVYLVSIPFCFLLLIYLKNTTTGFLMKISSEILKLNLMLWQKHKLNLMLWQKHKLKVILYLTLSESKKD